MLSMKEKDAKTEKVTPKHLSKLILEYCEAAGYTILG